MGRIIGVLSRSIAKTPRSQKSKKIPSIISALQFNVIHFGTILRRNAKRSVRFDDVHSLMCLYSIL